jgi:hypothetical protein
MKTSYLILLSLLLIFVTGCDDKFDEINTDPTRSSESTWNPNFFLPNAQNQVINHGYRSMLYQSTMMQVLASTYNYFGNGDKYINTANSATYQADLFNNTYSVGTILAEMIRLSEGREQFSNLQQVGRILQVLNMQKGTDTYGDLPYSEAFKAKEGISFPKYDTQQSIYTAMLQELEDAVKKLDANKPKITGDLYYGGDVDKWKKFGNSLMLRVAMRLTKVDPATAKAWAEKAVAAGVFTSIADNAKFMGDPNSARSSYWGVLQVADDFRELRWSKTFIDVLKATNDPRLGAISEVPADGAANNANQNLQGNNSPAVQMGLPNGFDLTGGPFDIRSYSGYPGPTGSGNDIAPLGRFSRPRISVYLKQNGTLMVLTYAETELMLAEAKARGWNVPGTAAEHYRNGVVAAMASMAQLDASATISNADAMAYVNANPLDESSLEKSLELINKQYWLATGTMFNFLETWYNWKRSGYPVLTPVNFPGNVTNGRIPRRMPYLQTEMVNNKTNLAEAVSRLQGGDDLTSRVWWDK